MLRALILMTSLAFAGGAMAQYKWVDKNGKVQYGDTPPAGANATPLRPVPPTPIAQPEPKKDDAQKAPPTLAERDADFRKRQQESAKEREKQAQAQREAEDKRENCARAKENLRVMESGRVSRIDAKGERHYLDESQLAQATAKARQVAQEWCN